MATLSDMSGLVDLLVCICAPLNICGDICRQFMGSTQTTQERRTTEEDPETQPAVISNPVAHEVDVEMGPKLRLNPPPSAQPQPGLQSGTGQPPPGLQPGGYVPPPPGKPRRCLPPQYICVLAIVVFILISIAIHAHQAASKNDPTATAASNNITNTTAASNNTTNTSVF